MARHFPAVPLADVVGRTVKIIGTDDRWREIVGVVRHIHQSALDEPLLPQIYGPWPQMLARWQLEIGRAMDVAIRSPLEPQAVISTVRKDVQVLGPVVPLSHIRTLQDAIASSMEPRVFSLALLAGFALTALVLAMVGVYGVMNHLVTQRTREIAVRMAQARDAVRFRAWSSKARSG